MEKLNLNRNIGIKEYCFADDENAIIRINTRDPNLYPRIKETQKKLIELVNEYEGYDKKTEDEACKALLEFDLKVKSLLDYMFDSKVSEVVFGNSSSVATYDGVPAFQNFLNVILPIVEKDMEAEQKKIEKNIRKYTSQVKK